MNILMVSAEVFPFAKTGGLADAVSALSISLSLVCDTNNQNCANDVKIIMPRYYKIDRNELNLTQKSLFVNLGFQEILVDIYETQLLSSNVKVYFVDFEKLFGREGIYGDCFGDFKDNPLRFSVLARSVFSLCKKINWIPDIIHAHDWSASLSSIFLKYIFCNDAFFSQTKSVLTIHNMGYQGQFPVDAYKILGLSEDLRFKSGLENLYSINFLKGGIASSDFITTVSPTYAKEILTFEGGFGLDGLMRVRQNSLKGILNGADTALWNPQNDSLIPFNYSSDDFSGKEECKRVLQKEFCLEEKKNVPIIGMVGRLAEQKGINEMFKPCYGCLYRICSELKVQVVLVGSGELWCEKEISELSKKLTNFSAYIGYNEKISHLVEAGSDFFLMPSKYEPCGLNQIYSLLYGTIPIVRRTGGLADTVEQYNEETAEGTGFFFNDLTPDAIFNTVKYAVQTYYERTDHIKKIKSRAMQKQFLWQQSATEYMKVYKSILSTKSTTPPQEAEY